MSSSKPSGILRSTHDTTGGAELAISVQGVSKSFSIPMAEPETIGDRLRHPLRALHRREHVALQDVSFEVARGEFFGIVGGNGSGKTTLLQILANVYRPDRGTVLIAPRVAPIISLGIGFHPELPALPNVLQTAELLGVPAAEARARFDEVLAFAGLDEFADLKLRNYSSGMRVRLAFAITMLVDADVLLLDEVLAVGDGGFREKARKTFEADQRERAIVLVTHNMSDLQKYCDRALLLNRGRVEMLGDPTEVARRYAELALETHGQTVALPSAPVGLAAMKPRSEIADLWLAGANGERTASLEAGEGIVLHATVAATAKIREPGLRFEIRKQGGARIFAPPTVSLGEPAKGLRAGARLQVETAIENKLTPGAYTVVCAVTATREWGERAISPARTIDFVVAPGSVETHGFVDLEHSVRVRRRERKVQERQGGGGPAR